MLKARFGADLDPLIRRVLPFVARTRVHPDVLTLLGVALATLSGVAFALERPLAAGIVLVFAGFFDLIDGVVARAQGTSSTSGAFFDSAMDRLADIVVLGGIATAMAAQADSGGVVLALWALGGSVMTSYTRARAERHLARFDVGLMERGERFAVLIVGALTGFVELALWIVAIGASYTTVQRVLAARRLLAELDRTGVDPTAPPQTQSDQTGARNHVAAGRGAVS